MSLLAQKKLPMAPSILLLHKAKSFSFHDHLHATHKQVRKTCLQFFILGSSTSPTRSQPYPKTRRADQAHPRSCSSSAPLPELSVTKIMEGIFLSYFQNQINVYIRFCLQRQYQIFQLSQHRLFDKQTIHLKHINKQTYLVVRSWVFLIRDPS